MIEDKYFGQRDINGNPIIFPDHNEVCWQTGSESFSRKEVAYLLYTQRAMIANDLKAFCGNSLTPEMFEIISNPRQPEY